MSEESVAKIEANTNHVQEIEVLSEYVPARPIKIRGRDGKEFEYEVNETNGGVEFWKWLERLGQMEEKMKDSVPTDFADIQLDLLCQCLTLNRTPVPRETIGGWGKAIKKRLYDICMEMNGMSKAAVEQEGKDSGDGAKSGGG